MVAEAEAQGLARFPAAAAAAAVGSSFFARSAVAASTV